MKKIDKISVWIDSEDNLGSERLQRDFKNIEATIKFLEKLKEDSK